MSFHGVDVWGDTIHMLSPLSSQCHEVSVELVHIPFIRPLSAPCPKHPHPPLPASLAPTLWSVSRFQILNEVEDINSEWSYGGGEGGGRERGHLMGWTLVVRKRVTYYLLQKLSVIKKGEHQRLHILNCFPLWAIQVARNVFNKANIQRLIIN